MKDFLFALLKKLGTDDFLIPLCSYGLEEVLFIPEEEKEDE